MATAVSMILDLTKCPICLEVFDNPKSLTCLHAFCLQCLKDYFKDNYPGDDVLCPLCRKEFNIPADGLDGLQHHFIVQQLVDAQKASSEEANEVPCEVCLHESGEDLDKIATATTYCVDCDQKLCEQCSRRHRRMKGGTHQLRSLGAELEPELIKLRRSYCDKHTDKQIELYCYDCNENFCLMCSAVKHRQHETAEITEAAKTCSQQINFDAQQVWSLIHNVQEKAQEKEIERIKFLTLVDKVKSEIKVTGNKIKETVDNQVTVQLDQVDMIMSEHAERAAKVEESYELALVQMESFRTYSRELLDKGKPSDITVSASELHKRALELLHDDVTTVQYCPAHLTFTPADVTQVKRLNLIGVVTLALKKQPGTCTIILPNT